MMSSDKPSFAAEFEPAVLGRRRVPRAPVSLDAKVGRGGLDRALCRVVDLSLHGAKIETFSALRRDSMIWLTLPHVGHWAARVVWATDFEAGLEFQIALTEGEFEKLAA
ncbi:PilZ domain-containing protein [Sphingomonas sp.]|uniref:PilZ domain-containing protein n=1 Tax=Sphingomonas sp. TaxID=28214 RepID=UPI002ED886DF